MLQYIFDVMSMASGEIGFLLVWESLLSCAGSEFGMIDDMHVAVQASCARVGQYGVMMGNVCVGQCGWVPCVWQ